MTAVLRGFSYYPVVHNIFILFAPLHLMAIGITLFVIGALIAAIWIIIEVKRLKHKVFAIFLIVLILFTYLSFSHVVKKNDVDLKTIPGIYDGGKLYLSWLGGIFGNFKSITTNAIKMDWSGDNETYSGT